MLAPFLVMLVLVLATLSNASSNSLRVQSAARDEEEATVTSRSFSLANAWTNAFRNLAAPQSVSAGLFC